MNENALYVSKLAESGISVPEGKALGFSFLNPKTTENLDPAFRKQHSLKIQYFDPISKLPLKPLPKHPNFFRIRYLGKNPPGFTSGSQPKYQQPTNSCPAVYFPKTAPWEMIINDPDLPIFITEGELKAAKATLDGYPCIGLGGVDSFAAKKWGFDLLPHLKMINWVKRTVYIVYDSDFIDNPQVCSALNRLAERLHQEGAIPWMVILPQEDEKVGLDDWLVENGAPKFQELIDDAEMLTLSKSLLDMNDRFAVVVNPPAVWDFSEGAFINLKTFIQTHGHISHAERVLRPDGTISLKRVKAAPKWMTWDLRNTIRGVVFSPGDKPMVDNKLNLWKGWPVAARKGTVKPFLQLVDYVFQDAEPEHKKWFLQWCAYPIQYPGTKLYTATVIFGIHHGTGKSLLGRTISEVYGQYATTITSEHLHASFNSWLANTQFALGDEVTSGAARKEADTLKRLITQTSVRINEKFVAEYMIQDCVNFFFTSNHPDAFFLEDGDRRFFIHELKQRPMEEIFYKDYDLWLASTSAKEALFYYLKNEVNTDDFSAEARAPRTSAKMEMTRGGKSDVASWVDMLKEVPEEILRLGQKPLDGDLYSSKQLLDLYDPMEKTRVTANGIGREMKRHGFKQANNGRIININGRAARYIIVRNFEKWDECTDVKKMIKHIEETNVEGKY